MKPIKLLVVLLICTVQLVFAQDKYKRVKITNVNETTIQQLDDLGIDLTCGVVLTNNQLTLELSQYELDLITGQDVGYTVLIDDMTQFYKKRAIEDLPTARAEIKRQTLNSKAAKSFSVKNILNNVGQYDDCDEIDWAVPTNWNLNPTVSPNSFGGCLTYAQVLQELDDMRAMYPNLISVKTNASPSNQLTYEGRTVYMVRISDNPDTDEAGEPETLYQSLIHSREAATVMNQLFFMWYLLENYSTDDAIKNLVNNQALYFIPVFNPDGFVYNQTVAPDGGGGQRKNRNTSASGSCSTYAEGIDLNRNSAYYWGNGGSSSSSCSGTYMGTAPFSENETQIMRDFFLLHDFKLALNHHSYKNAMLHAYAGTNITNPRPNEYSKYNHDMTRYNRYAHGPSTSISSLNSGNMNDWMLGGLAGTSSVTNTPTGTGSGKNTMAWTPENGLSSEGSGGTYSGFWPTPSNFLPIARRAMRMNFLAAYYSGKYAKLHDLNQSDITSLSGNLNFAIENLGQTSSDFTLTITPVSTNITVGSPSTQTGMSVLQQNTVAISYTLDPGILPDDEIEFKVVLTNDYASGNVLFEANIVKRYNPTVLFSDNPDSDNLTNWTSSGGTWSTTADAYSGSKAITSTATAPYANNTSKTLQMNGSVDLTGVSTALIQFYGKWDLERSYDYVTIEGSTDGSSWIELCGKLTKPGAPTANNSYSSTSGAGDNANKSNLDDAKQNGITALYDGDTQDKWNMEEVVIDVATNSFLYNQSTVFLRFNLNTDSSNRKDSYQNANFEGFSFDDFKIIEIKIPCVTTVPTGLSVSSITATTANVNWDAIPSATYDIRYRVVGSGTWIDINDQASNTYSLTGLTATTNYEIQARSKCSALTSAYTSSVNFTTLAVNYCPSNGNNTDDEYIGNVTLGTINNNSGVGTTSTGYSDYTGSPTATQTTDLDIDAVSHSISVSKTWPSSGTGPYNEAVSIWIDFNKNGVFTDAGEQVFTSSSNQTTPVSGTFSIPSIVAGTVLGNTRMRVSMKYNAAPTDPCESFGYGEVEDYTVNIYSSVLGVDSESAVLNTISIYPNPVKEQLFINVPNTIKLQHYKITNMLGQSVLKGKLKLNNKTISVNTLNTGIYFVTLSTDKGRLTKKIIVH